jgi:hypothetical protein
MALRKYSHMTVLWYDIYLTATGLTPGGSSTHLHTNNTQNNTNKQYIEQHIMDTKQYIEQHNSQCCVKCCILLSVTHNIAKLGEMQFSVL